MFNDITEADVGVLEVCTYARINSSGKQYFEFLCGEAIEITRYLNHHSLLEESNVKKGIRNISFQNNSRFVTQVYSRIGLGEANICARAFNYAFPANVAASLPVLSLEPL